MPDFIVKETMTVLRFIEADSEAQALEIAKERGCGDWDEVDNSIGTTFSVELDQAASAPSPK